MDISKIIFRTILAVVVLGGFFVVGLYSGHHRNGLHQLVYGTFDQTRLVIKELPNLTKSRPIHFLRKARYDGEGVTVNAGPDKTDEYLLLSGFFKDHNGVRLIERDGTIVHEWNVSIFDTVGDPSFCRNPPATEWNAIPHGTIIEPDGTITLGFESCGMIKLDRCSAPVWAQTELITHHSPNFMSNGDIVIAGGEFVPDGPNVQWPYDDEYWEDLIFVFSPDGTLKKSKRMTDLYIENDYQAILTATGKFATWINGEFHLNEVEELSPELAPAFPMFEAGDLLLSIRNRNMIMVVDAEMETIKWHQIGPWIRQHDPDFQPDGTITLYDNNTDETNPGRRSGGSRIYRVDPTTGETEIVYGGTPETHFYSRERATHQMQPDGSVLVTEAQGGRVFQVDSAGEIIWEWVNRYDEDNVTWMHDASILPKSFFEVSDWSCS
ncbi:arylsulfotransferase family protein [Ruegeria sp. HKCCA5763]|uniref:arylsulfotransferase family protein n=1 Tax=Ruegeria sp. HKCCA5763 TaxID=2682987 RepID=UPI0014898A0F|nr:arylsulfotransferase family protein [Ruegeria sp. HKCCA5763]